MWVAIRRDTSSSSSSFLVVSSCTATTLLPMPFGCVFSRGTIPAEDGTPVLCRRGEGGRMGSFFVHFPLDGFFLECLFFSVGGGDVP